MKLFSNQSVASALKKARAALLEKRPSHFILIVAGFLATLWFLVRVIPKPSRAGYPCMRAAAPLMSGFVLYILSFTSAFAAFRKSKALFHQKKFAQAILLLVVGVAASGVFLISQQQKTTVAAPSVMIAPPDGANNPMGEGLGIFPGRVVWAWNPEATNAQCTNKPGDAFWDYKNNDTLVIRGMVEESIIQLTGTTQLKAAWDSVFTFHNRKKHSVERGYQNGETIFIKINQGTASWLLTSQEKANGFAIQSRGDIQPSWRTTHYATTETGPFIVLNLLRQLVHVAGVPQENIYIGDPMAHIYHHNFSVWHKEFPQVKYVDKTTDAHNRTFILPALESSMTYSDKGEVLGAATETYFEEMEDADYMINVACLKSHVRAGITLCTKNHFGSITRDGAGHLHPSLVSTSNNGLDQSNTGYDKYRVMVDIMGHQSLGGNTMLFVVEGLYGGSESEVKPPRKWNMQPFNGHWTSSVFMSLDQVALESVCYDFLRTEFNGINQPENYPNWTGVDDYLHQAATPENWPEGIVYNPDGNGALKSLGVHEHWNNADQKQYSRNLGSGNGIELVQVSGKLVSVPAQIQVQTLSLETFPNPVSNAATIRFSVEDPALLTLSLYTADGRLIQNISKSRYDKGTHQIQWNVASNVKTGAYILTISGNSEKNKVFESKKIQVIK